eukprot:317103-Amphidinium_carterae.1
MPEFLHLMRLLEEALYLCLGKAAIACRTTIQPRMQRSLVVVFNEVTMESRCMSAVELNVELPYRETNCSSDSWTFVNMHLKSLGGRLRHPICNTVPKLLNSVANAAQCVWEDQQDHEQMLKEQVAADKCNFKRVEVIARTSPHSQDIAPYRVPLGCAVIPRPGHGAAQDIPCL